MTTGRNQYHFYEIADDGKGENPADSGREELL